jgi:hydrogenase maturation protein HypF
MFSKIVGDLVHQAPVGVISRRFHDGLVETFGRIAACIRERTSLDRVCLSGGTFHNSYLLTHLVHRLEDQGFRVYTQKEVPAGDGGLGLGQALVALHQ